MSVISTRKSRGGGFLCKAACFQIEPVYHTLYQNPEQEGNLFHCADAYVTLVTVSDVDFLAGSLAGVDLLADPSAEAAATNADDDDDSDDSAAVPPASASAAAAAAAAECAITAAPAAIEGAEASAGAGTENAGMPSDRATPPPLQCTSRLPLPPRGMQTPPPTPPTLRAIAGPTPAARVSASGHVKLLPLQLPFELAPQTETEKLRFEVWGWRRRRCVWGRCGGSTYEAALVACLRAGS
eukprot:358344-Chlamydomonas_euryale.AAC.9